MAAVSSLLIFILLVSTVFFTSSNAVDENAFERVSLMSVPSFARNYTQEFKQENIDRTTCLTLCMHSAGICLLAVFNARNQSCTTVVTYSFLAESQASQDVYHGSPDGHMELWKTLEFTGKYQHLFDTLVAPKFEMIGKPTKQDSTYHVYTSDRAVDGNGYDGLGLGDGYCMHTHMPSAAQTWFVADTESLMWIQKIVVYNRVDSDTAGRFADMTIGVSARLMAWQEPSLNLFHVCHFFKGPATASPVAIDLPCKSPLRASRYVLVYKAAYSMHFCEIEVFSFSY